LLENIPWFTTPFHTHPHFSQKTFYSQKLQAHSSGPGRAARDGKVMETHAVNLEKEEYHHDLKLEFNQEKFHKPLSISAWILSIFFPSTSTNCGRMLSGLVVPETVGNVILSFIY